MRDILARYHNTHLQRPTIKTQKSVCQNLTMQQSYGSRKIFLPAFLMSRFSNTKFSMAISWAKPYVAAPGAGLAGKPMGAQPYVYV
jgi:hypothetical protein